MAEMESSAPPKASQPVIAVVAPLSALRRVTLPVPSSTANSSVSSISAASAPTCPLAGPGAASRTWAVPAAVPSVTQSSRP